MLHPLTVPVTLHLGDPSWERRPHFLGSRQPASSLQQRGALLEVLPRLPQAAARRTSQRTRRSSSCVIKHSWLAVWSKCCFITVSAAVLAGDKGLHEEQGWLNWHEQDVGEETEMILTSHDTVSQGSPYWELKEKFMSCCTCSDPRNVYSGTTTSSLVMVIRLHDCLQSACCLSAAVTDAAACDGQSPVNYAKCYCLSSQHAACQPCLESNRQ